MQERGVPGRIFFEMIELFKKWQKVPKITELAIIATALPRLLKSQRLPWPFLGVAIPTLIDKEPSKTAVVFVVVVCNLSKWH